MEFSKLEALLAAEIREKGPIGFDRFMNLALYHPEEGYYGSGRARIGQRGDFVTSVSVGSCFGKLLQRQFNEIQSLLQLAGKERTFSLIEQGAADGQLMGDVLSAGTWANGSVPDVLLVEPLEHLRVAQFKTLATIQGVAPVEHATSWENLAANRSGVFFCNELLDAMPFKIVRFKDGQWWERRVALRGDAEMTGSENSSSRLAENAPEKNRTASKFIRSRSPPSSSSRSGSLEEVERNSREVNPDKTIMNSGVDGCFDWIDAAISHDELLERTRLLGTGFPDGYTTEINLCYQRWIEELSRRFHQGVLFVMDYGFSREDFYHPGRTEGTLRTFRKQRAGGDPLDCPGSQDITSHVEFTELAQRAEQAGLDVLGFVDQNHFLMGIGESWLLDLELKMQPAETSGTQGRAADQTSNASTGHESKRACLKKGVEERKEQVEGASIQRVETAEGASSARDKALVRQFQTLTHPGMMGRDFKVLVLGKNVPDRIAKSLSCLRYARPWRNQLGLGIEKAP